MTVSSDGVTDSTWCQWTHHSTSEVHSGSVWWFRFWTFGLSHQNECLLGLQSWNWLFLYAATRHLLKFNFLFLSRYNSVTLCSGLRPKTTWLLSQKHGSALNEPFWSTRSREETIRHSMKNIQLHQNCWKCPLIYLTYICWCDLNCLAVMMIIMIKDCQCISEGKRGLRS